MKDVSDINQAIWFSNTSTAEYARQNELFAPEKVALAYASEKFPNATVLDIGIGAGRTTAFLEPTCTHYIGIDYSLAMINFTKKLFPQVTLHHMDARDLSHFADQTFHTVWFSYNGIDYVNHDDRIKILNEIQRILKLRGLLIFSTHNRDCKIYPAHHLKHLKLSFNPMRMARGLLNYLQGIYQSKKLTRQEIRTNDYAILNDPAHGFKMLTYYISSKNQIAQLHAAGFTTEMVLGVKGEALDRDKIYSDGYCIYYVVRINGDSS